MSLFRSGAAFLKKKASQTFRLDPNRASDEAAGYRIDENDRLVVLGPPSMSLGHFGNKNDRHNETGFERMNDMCRHEIEKRSLAEGMTIGYIPGRPAVAPSEHPSTRPQVPIFYSNFAHLPEKCSRLVLLIGNQSYDPHITSYNILNNKGVDAGSIAGLIKNVHARHGMGLVIANPGQRIWSKTLRKAMTYRSWMALPRDKATDAPFSLDLDNYIEGNGDPAIHLGTLFRDLIMPTIRNNSKKPKVYIICYGSTDHMMEHMQEKWVDYKKVVESIVVCNGTIDGQRDLPHPGFAKFWSERCKSYHLDTKPLNTPVDAGNGLPNCFSSGTMDKGENIFHAVCNNVLDYFDYLHYNPMSKLPDFKLPHSHGSNYESGNTEDSWVNKHVIKGKRSAGVLRSKPKMLPSVAEVDEAPSSSRHGTGQPAMR